MSTMHPSELDLERHLLSVRPDVAAHAEGCARCRERLSEMALDGDDFLRRVLPSTLPSLESRSAASVGRGGLRGWRPWSAWLGVGLGGLSLVAAGAVLLVVLRPPPAPPEGYVGIKGGGLQLSVFTEEEGAARLLTEGAPLRADAPLRFRVGTHPRCHLWVVSVDGAGQLSPLFPAGGERSAPAPENGALPGGAQLDGQPGPERLYAVCTDAPLPLTTLRRAVAEGVGRGEEAVRRATLLPSLPGATQTTLLLEKQ